MTEHQRQLLSAYLDDALDATEAAEFSSMLDSTAGNADLAQTLQTYVLIGEAMRGREAQHTSRVAARVAQAIRAEPPTAHAVQVKSESNAPRAATVVSMPKRRAPRWQRVARSVAMAATVAAVAIGAMRLLYSEAELDAGSQVAAVNTVSAVSNATANVRLPVKVLASTPANTDGRATRPVSPVPSMVSSQPQSVTVLPPVKAHSTHEWDRLQPTVEARVQAYFLQHNEVTRNSVRGMLPYARLVGYESSRD